MKISRALTALLGTLLATAVPTLAQPDLEFDARDAGRGVRAALFRAPGFPTADAPVLDGAVLSEALAGLPVDTIASVDELLEKLRLRDYDVLILPYGSAFPLDAWIPIRFFLERGGGLVVLGGAPFHQPVLENGDGPPGGDRAGNHGFRLGVRQPTFAHELLIGPADVWKRPDGGSGLKTLPVAESEWILPLGDAATVQELVVRLATKKDLPQEAGSEGHRDAVLRPLVHVLDPDGLPVACPLLEIDHIRGAKAGARWVLATSDAALGAREVRAIVERALEGAAELDARPVHASVEPGEMPEVRVFQRRPFVRAGETVPDTAEVLVKDDEGREVFYGEVELVGEPQARQGVVPIRTDRRLVPGLYHVEVKTPRAPWRPRWTTTGFWVRDDDLLASAPPVTVSRDWLRRGGEVFPVVGTTYMASDIHRKFLFEPNPHVWDRDFAQMASLGINFVRTGTWTGHSRAMLNSGAIDEGFLRALDAYVLSAAKNGIVVNYTFFAFLPSAYGAANPYLDPRALEGQRELLTAVARRYRGVHWIHWDLINEPSYAPPEKLWSTSPIRDPYEIRAWKEWVRARHGDDVTVLRNRWQDDALNVLALPEDRDFYSSQIRDGRLGRKGRDFLVFAQEPVTEWARTLREILRTAGGDELVTLGQDEGGTFTRSSQQIHAEAVDYTGIHPWWRNDDLLATGVLSKVPEKPNLFQETGLMRLEDLDGWSWRSPELAARVLESKYAFAFGARAAGVVEWAWNINPYQPIDNESVIGFWRPDGTAKPELRIVPELAAFMKEAVPYLDDFEPDPVVAVIPHSRLFLGLPGGADGLKRMIRVLAERYGVVPTGLSELRLTKERLKDAKLVIVPAPYVLEDGAAKALLDASRAGAKVLVTGLVTGNPYGEVAGALAALGVADAGRPVLLREESSWGGSGWATFDNDSREKLRRSNAGPLASLSGNVWHEPLPLEFAREDEPLAALLGAALQAAGVTTQPSEEHVMARLLYAPKAVLAVVVNETASDAVRRLVVEGQAFDVPVASGRSRLVLFERGTPRVIVATSGGEVSAVE